MGSIPRGGIRFCNLHSPSSVTGQARPGAPCSTQLEPTSVLVNALSPLVLSIAPSNSTRCHCHVAEERRTSDRFDRLSDPTGLQELCTSLQHPRRTSGWIWNAEIRGASRALVATCCFSHLPSLGPVTPSSVCTFDISHQLQTASQQNDHPVFRGSWKARFRGAYFVEGKTPAAPHSA
jgi:hypothetical protein